MNRSKSLLPFLILLLFLGVSCDDEGPFVDLPVSIQSYLDANYPDAEMEESELDTLCTGMAVYEVELEVNDDEELELTFDTDGNLLFTETEISAGSLPTAVTNTVETAHPGQAIEEADRLDFPDGSVQYEVELGGSNPVELLVSADGEVICEEDGDTDDEE